MARTAEILKVKYLLKRTCTARRKSLARTEVIDGGPIKQRVSRQTKG